MCLENVIYITKQEKVSIYYLSPFLGEFVRAKRKPNFGNVIGQRKNSPRKSAISFFYLSVENGLRDAILVIVIVLPVKYLFNSSLRIILIFESRRVLSPAFSTTFSIIRTIRPLFADYSSTIRRLFVDYSYYSSTIRFTISHSEVDERTGD